MEQIGFHGLDVGVVDERGEIAAMYQGVPQNDVGLRTDVLDNIPKALGMKMLIRSMAPKVIAADEIGSREDVEAICYAFCCGVKGIFKAHGEKIKNIKKNPAMQLLVEQGMLERIIFLKSGKDKGEVDRVYELQPMQKQYILAS